MLPNSFHFSSPLFDILRFEQNINIIIVFDIHIHLLPKNIRATVNTRCIFLSKICCWTLTMVDKIWGRKKTHFRSVLFLHFGLLFQFIVYWFSSIYQTYVIHKSSSVFWCDFKMYSILYIVPISITFHQTKT